MTFSNMSSHVKFVVVFSVHRCQLESVFFDAAMFLLTLLGFYSNLWFKSLLEAGRTPLHVSRFCIVVFTVNNPRSEQAVDCCKKDGTYLQLVEPTNPGRRTDLEDIKSKVRAKGPLARLLTPLLHTHR